MLKRPLLAVALLVALGATAAACGNDDGDGGGVATGGDAERFCEAFADINEEGEAAFEGGEPDPDELRSLVARAGDLDPPDEIADDYRTVIEAQRLFADAFDGDVDAQGELESRFDEFEEADEGLEPFMRDECGLDYGD